MSVGLLIETDSYLLKLMRPGDETQAWKDCLADPALMAKINGRPSNRSLLELRDYLAVMNAQRKAVIGLYEKNATKHIGVIEMQFDERHKSISLTHLIFRTSDNFSTLITEIDPPLVSYFSDRFRIAKFSTVVPASYRQLIDALPAVGWTREGLLREEFPSTGGHGRIDAVVLGKTQDIDK